MKSKALTTLICAMFFFCSNAQISTSDFVTENGCTDISACYTINNVGLEEKSTAGINTFPNPSSGSFTLQFSEPSFSGKLEIYSLNGQLVHEQKIENQGELELHLELPKGIYLLRLSSQNQNITQRLIIQ